MKRQLQNAAMKRISTIIEHSALKSCQKMERKAAKKQKRKEKKEQKVKGKEMKNREKKEKERQEKERKKNETEKNGVKKKEREEKETKESQNPNRVCQSRPPPPTLGDDNLTSSCNLTLMGDDELPLCECHHRGVNSLHTTVLGTPSFLSLETKESGLEFIRRMLEPLEVMSTCKRCSRLQYFRVYLHLLCNLILDKCREFYKFLVRMYEDTDQQPILQGDYKLATVEERASLLCLVAHVEMKRFHDSVNRLIQTLKEQQVFDEDAWDLLRGQAYKLAVDSANLSCRSICC